MKAIIRHQLTKIFIREVARADGTPMTLATARCTCGYATPTRDNPDDAAGDLIPHLKANNCWRGLTCR